MTGDFKKKVIIFGTEEIARLALVYLSRGDQREIACFCVDRKYLIEEELMGYPVFPFEDIINICPPETHEIFLGLSYGSFNETRKSIFERIRKSGYCISSLNASQKSTWVDITGEGSVILDHATIQPGCIVGENVFISPGCSIGHDTIINDHAFFGPGVITCGNNSVGASAFIGAGTIIGPGVTVADGAFVGTGARIFRDTHPGNAYIERSTLPAKIDLQTLTPLLYKNNENRRNRNKS
jgi:sugar O-acyltransferase (sialic acid O-acetyltransferase NeuD family)